MHHRTPLRKAFKPPAMANKTQETSVGQENIPNAAEVNFSTAQPQRPDTTDARYFSVLYSKHAPNKKRRNKNFADGVLAVKDGSVTLFSHEGKQVGKSKLSFQGALENGVCLVVGGNEVELDEPLSPGAFTSGSCFMVAPSTTTAPSTMPQNPRITTGFKRVKPVDAAARPQAPPRPLHNPAAPDALICNQPELVCVNRVCSHPR